MLRYVRLGGAPFLANSVAICGTWTARGLKTQTLCYAMFVLVEPRTSKHKPYAMLCSFWWSQGPQNANSMLISCGIGTKKAWLMHGCWRLAAFEANSPIWLPTRQCNFPNVARPLSQEKRGGYFARIIYFMNMNACTYNIQHPAAAVRGPKECSFTGSPGQKSS